MLDSVGEIQQLFSEDFSFYLKQCKGCYIWIGSNEEGEEIIPLHSSKYNFNDYLIPIGTEYWFNLARYELGKSECD